MGLVDDFRHDLERLPEYEDLEHPEYEDPEHPEYEDPGHPEHEDLP